MDFQGTVEMVGCGRRQYAKVVVTYEGQQHEMHVPEFHREFLDVSDALVCKEAELILRCLSNWAIVEHGQRAASALGEPIALGGLWPAYFELHGSFADLVQQLQECVDWRRTELCECDYTAAVGLLTAAATLGHFSAAQQLLSVEPGAAFGPSSHSDPHEYFPAFAAAMSPRGTSVLRLLLAVQPGLVHSVVGGDSGDNYGQPGGTLLHEAALKGNVESMQLLLQLAPELASARSRLGVTPLHQAAGNGAAEPVQLLLEAAPDTAAAVDSRGALPMHWATWAEESTDALSVLINAGAPGMDVPMRGGCLPLHEAAHCEEATSLLLAAHPAAALVADHAGCLPLHHAVQRNYAAAMLLLEAKPEAARMADNAGRLPLHHAAQEGRCAVVRMLLEVHPAGALVQDSQGRTPLQLALQRHNFWAASILLPASGMTAAQLLDAFDAIPDNDQPGLRPHYAALAAHLPLSPAQWQRMPAPCPGLGRALPAVLERSEAEAALLVAHLPPAAVKRLRTAALSLHHLQSSLQLEVAVPAPLVGRILALSLSDV